MTSKAMNCVRSIGIGLAVGTAASVVCKYVANNKKHTLKYRARHAADLMEDLFDNVSYLFK